MKIRPLQKLADWLAGKPPALTEEQVKQQLRHDMPMLEGLASGEIARIGKKDLENLTGAVHELRAKVDAMQGAHCPGCDSPGCRGLSTEQDPELCPVLVFGALRCALPNGHDGHHKIGDFQ